MGNSIPSPLLSWCQHEGDSFDSRFAVDEANCIGTGKFAQVHLCWRKSQCDRRYALKVINTKVGDMASLNRIREEISILQVVGQHRHLVSLVDVDETLVGSIRLVLELCEGGELYDRIQQKKHYPESEAKLCCRQLLDACAYIHSKGIMHRDLKPENILLTSRVSNTDLKISDFGLAKISRDYPRRLPRSNSICGSDFYLAPEVIKQEEYGREIDIWALGVIAYVLLSGSLPFFNSVLHKLYRQIVERDLSFPEQAWVNVSKGALDFILRLLQVRAGDRLTSDQSLQHPWLRGSDGGASFDVVESPNDLARCPSNTGSMHSWSQVRKEGIHHNLHPLEHAHKVKGQDRGPPQRPGSARQLEHGHKPQQSYSQRAPQRPASPQRSRRSAR